MSKSLAQQFDALRWAHKPSDMTDSDEIQLKFEQLYDAVIPIMDEYRATLEEDSPLALYLNYFLRAPIEIMDDENSEPELYATVPVLMDDEEPITSMGNVKDVFTSFTTVRITAASPLGDIGITRNLSAPRGFETRVFWDSLTRYRVKP
jgi:hypothetical protein